MKQIILEHTEIGYKAIGFSKNCDLLIYMQEFLESLTLEQAFLGIQNFRLRQINDFMVEYGNKENKQDFYVAFWNLIDATDYETEVNGITILHDEKIPKLKLSYENFDYIFKQWAHIKQTLPPYVIIEQDSMNFVHLYDKTKLNIEEHALVEQHKKEVARKNNELRKKINSLN